MLAAVALVLSLVPYAVVLQSQRKNTGSPAAKELIAQHRANGGQYVHTFTA